MKIITIHQPEHLPWLGLFNKIAKAETFVLLDTVQFEKNYFQNRNRIMGTSGEAQWIGIPVNTKNHEENNIKNTKIQIAGNTKNWKKEYLRTITYCYSKYPFFNDVFPIIIIPGLLASLLSLPDGPGRCLAGFLNN